MNTSTVSRFLFAALLVGSLLVGTASASPFFSIGEGTGTSWAAAAPNIEAATSLSFSAQAFYDNQLGEQIGAGPAVVEAIGVAVPTLQPFNPVSDGAESHDSLVMSWDHDAFPDTTLVVAAWEYVYGVDPDLSNKMVHFSAFPPVGVWDLSLELIDINGRSRGWFAASPPNVWTDFWLNVDINPVTEAGAPQAPFNAFIEQPLFDLTQVVSIRLNESSVNNPSLMPFTQVNPTTGLLTPWNAWNHLKVTPEPSSAALVGFGFISLLGYARRRRK